MLGGGDQIICFLLGSGVQTALYLVVNFFIPARKNDHNHFLTLSSFFRFSDCIDIHETWPDMGDIQFRHIALNYDPEQSPVVRDATFTIRDAEKVGDAFKC